MLDDQISATMNNGIIIRRITDTDAKGLAELYDRVWPENAGRHLEKTEWAIKTTEFAGFCAECDGLIIGSRSCFHTNIYIGQERYTCVQFGDSCVDEEYRGKGLFSKMNKSFLADFFKTGDEFIYNISVEASRKAYEKLGWNYVDALSKLLLIVNPFSFIRKTKGDIRLLSGNITEDYSAIPDISVFPVELLNHRESLFVDKGLIHTKYDLDTLLWRVSTDSNMKVWYDADLGGCIYKTGHKNGLKYCVIGEVFLVNQRWKNFNRIIRVICRLNNVDVVETSLCHSHPLYSYYKHSGFICNPFKRYLNLGVKVSSERMRSLCYNPTNWALSNLDIDTF